MTIKTPWAGPGGGGRGGGCHYHQNGNRIPGPHSSHCPTPTPTPTPPCPSLPPIGFINLTSQTGWNRREVRAVSLEVGSAQSADRVHTALSVDETYLAVLSHPHQWPPWHDRCSVGRWRIPQDADAHEPFGPYG